ncbi:kinase, pfkB family protein [Besnoitia besnoiti]|uniref:Adenosine kinase n=1 Tax=Besnoitia besnoiti TaxID=94643 RepID=A0A2A9M6H4_BESBE|nr:kinase, pfkB family protein [Besnoitia besnoiti]PFH31486.1 kinase, pfkB family protein [Besnoitia besnoiti]
MAGEMFVIGNPLLDMVAEVPLSFLEKFSLKRGEATLAESTQKPLYGELEQNFEVTFLPGGSGLNTARVTQALFQTRGAVAYRGAVGNDKHGQQLTELCEKEGVAVRFSVIPEQETGVCAVLVNEKERSLCTELGACLSFRLPEDWLALAPNARVFYAAAYALSASPDNVLGLARHCARRPDAVFAFNLSAGFCIELYKDAMTALFPLTNILIGNNEEYELFARVHGLVPDDAKEVSALNDTQAVEICKGALGLLTSGAQAGARKLAVMTRGKKSVIAAEKLADGTVVVYEEETPAVPDDKLVDTNGAGDAFAGGFLYGFLRGRSVRESIACGDFCAGNVIMHEGFAFDFSSCPFR